MSDKEEILKVIQTFFEVGKTKNFSVLRDVQVNSEEFSSYDETITYYPAMVIQCFYRCVLAQQQLKKIRQQTIQYNPNLLVQPVLFSSPFKIHSISDFE